MEKKKIEIIVRAIIKKGNKILLCKNIERGHYYLPGGHLETNENLLEALKREFFEETGENLRNIKFLGILENFYKEKGILINEINIIFKGEIKNKNIKSKEDYITFEWIKLKEIDKIKLLPKKMKDFVKKKGKFFIEENV